LEENRGIAVSEIRSLFRQSSHYFTGTAVVAVAGFISFPILTRLLSVSDYGLLGLISVTILVGQALGKLGAPSSIIRFFEVSKRENRIGQFYSSVFYGYVSLSLIVASVLFLIAITGSAHLFSQKIGRLLSITSALMFLNCFVALLTSTLRAQQRTRSWNAILVAQRYGMMGLGIVFLLIFDRKLEGYYVGQVVAESLVCFVCWMVVFGKTRVRINEFSGRLFRSLAKFGLPLCFSELGHLALSYFDRYLIQWFLGASALGVYTAGYNLATYATDIIMYPVNYAIDPIYMRIYTTKDATETAEFLSGALRYFCLIIFPVGFGFVAVSGVLLNILATEKYSTATQIMPFIIAGNGIYASQVILNAGLIIRKKTNVLMNVKIISCVLNVCLNLIFIRIYGIVGAAASTLASYLFYTVIIAILSFRELKFRIEIKAICLYLMSSILMYLAVVRLDLSNSVYSLIGKIIFGGVIYSVLVIALDSDLRRRMIALVGKG